MNQDDSMFDSLLGPEAEAPDESCFLEGTGYVFEDTVSKRGEKPVEVSNKRIEKKNKKKKKVDSVQASSIMPTKSLLMDRIAQQLGLPICDVGIETDIDVSSYGDFYVKIKNSQINNMVCLCCFIRDCRNGFIKKIKTIKKENAVNLRSHIDQQHREFHKPSKAREDTIQRIKSLFPQKIMWGTLKADGSVSAPRKRKKTDQSLKIKDAFRSSLHKKALLRQCHWLMMTGYPVRVVENDFYRRFVKTVDVNFDCQGRTSQGKRELIVFGFVIDLIKTRIQKSAHYFKEHFIALQCDAWTSQSLVSVLDNLLL